MPSLFGSVAMLCTLPQFLSKISWQTACYDGSCNFFYIVWHADKFCLHRLLRYFHNRDTCPWITILWLAHTAGIYKYLPINVLPVRFVGMAVDHDIGFNFFSHLSEELIRSAFVPIEVVFPRRCVKKQDFSTSDVKCDLRRQVFHVVFTFR